MIRVAVVDDDATDSELICGYINQYSESEKTCVETETFKDGMQFVTDYKPIYDICILDIEMPLLNGMDVAKRLREFDENIVILFVTNMAQYAIKGYEVSAVDFLVKPVSQFNFIDKFKKALAFVLKNDKSVVIEVDDGSVKLPLKSIYYIEKSDHNLRYVTERGEYFKRGNLKDISQYFASTALLVATEGVW